MNKHLDRVAALHRTAAPNSGATPGERDNAKRLAAKLQLKYNISDLQVKLRLQRDARPRPRFIFIVTYTRAEVARRHHIDPYKWRKWLRKNKIDWVSASSDENSLNTLVQQYKEDKPDV